ncbi:MAG: type I 3-dehydroquinate dehydratase [Thermoplasmatota archaeon]
MERRGRVIFEYDGVKIYSMEAAVSGLEAGSLIDNALVPILDEEPYSSVPKAVSEYEQYYNKKTFNTKAGTEVEQMVRRFPEWSGMSIGKSNVMEIRKEYTRFRKMGLELLELRLDSLNPRDSPESRARIAVFYDQIARFCTQGSMVSIPSGNHRGAVSTKYLSEGYRLELLKKLAEQGYSWIELDSDMDEEKFMEIAGTALTSGTRVMLSCYVREGMEWEPPEPSKIEASDGIMVFISAQKGPGLQRLVRTADLLRKVSGERKKVIRPISDDPALYSSILPLLGIDLIFFGEGPEKSPSVNALIGDPQPDDVLGILKRTGVYPSTPSSMWGLADRRVTRDTRTSFQIGSPDDDDLVLKVHNSLELRTGSRTILLPMNCGRERLNSFLENIRSFGASGIYIDKPFRSLVVDMLDWIDPRSKESGGVNLVVCKDRFLYGYNTEIYGISDVIKITEPKRESTVLVLGTSLSGRSAALASSMLGLRTHIAGSSLEKSQELASSLGVGIKGVSFNALKRPKLTYDIVINSMPFTEGGAATPGTSPEELSRNIEPAYGIELDRSRSWTPFLSSIESRGGIPIQGLDIFVSTIKRDQKLLYGLDVPEEMIKDVLTSL